MVGIDAARGGEEHRDVPVYALRNKSIKEIKKSWVGLA
jgi:hypothetical protein